MRWLQCWWRGHDTLTWMFKDGRLYAPPCRNCGAPNDELRRAHKWREVYTTEPPS